MKHSPFYNDLYRNISFKTLEEFSTLPVINKQIMMDNFSTLNTCGIDKDDIMNYAVEKENNKDYYGYYKDQYVVGLSSGTSGNKGIYITPKALTKRLPGVFLARGGLRLKQLPYRILFLLRVFSQGFDDINSKVVSLKYLSTMEGPQTIIDTINTDKRNIIMAPPSLLRQLLPYSQLISVPLKQIVCYAEVLHEEDKRQFEQAFQTKVIEIYQASEGQMASACKEGHLHINEDMVYVELYDKKGNIVSEPDVVGTKMIITNLVNKAQPLIRYEMNDLVVLDTKCPCGSNFRRIKHVLGRHDDILHFIDTSGTPKVIYPDLFVRWIIVTSDDIREFQVIQHSTSSLEIRIDCTTSSSFLQHDLRQKIETELAQYNITKINITILEQPIDLPQDKNKFKRFISKIDKNPPH
jgi:putative adenylate-forming enzyme